MAKKETEYFQCRVVKDTPSGHRTQTTWLPEAFAVEGKSLDLKNGDIWEQGWVVESVGEAHFGDEVIRSLSNQWRKYIETVDI
jgi:hypothetical protein